MKVWSSSNICKSILLSCIEKKIQQTINIRKQFVNELCLHGRMCVRLQTWSKPLDLLPQSVWLRSQSVCFMCLCECLTITLLLLSGLVTVLLPLPVGDLAGPFPLFSSFFSATFFTSSFFSSLLVFSGLSTFSGFSLALSFFSAFIISTFSSVLRIFSGFWFLSVLFSFFCCSSFLSEESILSVLLGMTSVFSCLSLLSGFPARITCFVIVNLI